MDNKILTIEEAKDAYLATWQYHNDTYKYQTDDGFYHLIIKGVDVLQGLSAVACHYYSKQNVVEYQTADGSQHKLKIGEN